MQLTLLGTGTSQGIPVIGCRCDVCQSGNPKDNRLRTSALLSHSDLNIAIDCGPDFRQQMLRAQVEQLHGILLTHTHNDHVAGLDDVRPFNFSMKRSMPIFGMKEHLDDIKSRYDYVFQQSPYPGAPKIDLVEIRPNKTFEIGGLSVLPLLLKHGQLDVLGFRVGDYAYLTDTNHIPDATMRQLKGLKVLILDSLHKREHHSHFNLDQSIQVALTVNADRTFFTHISHQMGLHQEVDRSLPSNIHLAYDGLKL